LNSFLNPALHLLFSFPPVALPLVCGLSSASSKPPLVTGLCRLFGLVSVDHLSGVCGLGVDVFGLSDISGEKWIVCRERAELLNGVPDRAVPGVKGVLDRAVSGVKGVPERDRIELNGVSVLLGWGISDLIRSWLVAGRSGMVGLSSILAVEGRLFLR
jgi:hypothetical protein